MRNFNDSKQEESMFLRKLCREIFGTDHPEDLKIIAQKAQKYDQLFNREYPLNQRNAGRKARFGEEERMLMLTMHRDGASVQEIASHFHTSRQTIYKYLEAEKREKENAHITMRMKGRDEDGEN